MNRGLWEKVQQHLHDHAARHRERPTKALPSPLAGRLFDENGEPLYAQGATKGGRRYRYYVSRDLVRGLAEQTQGGWRVPAPEIERAVIGAARGILDDKPVILAAIQTSAIDAPDMNHIFATTSDWSKRLLTETETAAAVVEVIERVQLTEDGIRVVLRIPIRAVRRSAKRLPRYCVSPVSS